MHTLLEVMVMYIQKVQKNKQFNLKVARKNMKISSVDENLVKI